MRNVSPSRWLSCRQAAGVELPVVTEDLGCGGEVVAPACSIQDEVVDPEVPRKSPVRHHHRHKKRILHHWHHNRVHPGVASTEDQDEDLVLEPSSEDVPGIYMVDKATVTNSTYSGITPMLRKNSGVDKDGAFLPHFLESHSGLNFLPETRFKHFCPHVRLSPCWSQCEHEEQCTPWCTHIVLKRKSGRTNTRC
ncbi:protein FAM153A isoform X1 [Macaca fascicularis]|uniref:protein FAM153A isoform X1 n=1 Tax=Macaca fascicularis TaxID=9541 RepID=UPI0032B065B1